MSGLDATWDQIRKAFDVFASRQSPRPPFTGFIAAAGGDGLVAGRDFVPEASYFSVRLVDMRLAEGGKYFVDYLPLGVCVAEYTHGTERRRTPLVLSNETVKQMLGDAGQRDPGHVQFANMPVVRRAPVKEDNLALFVGLFRMPYSDVASSVLQLAADVSEELGGAAFGAGTKIATKLYDRVSGLFGLKGVMPRFAFLDGMALTRSGYQLVSGPLPPDVKAEDFTVQGGRLRMQRDLAEPPENFDYCLLAIERRDSLFPAADSSQSERPSALLGALASLPFHAHWRNVASLLAKRKTQEAEDGLLTLRNEVVTSPDLSEEDRLIAIGAYDVAYTAFAQPLSAIPGGVSAATRGGRSATPVTGLYMVAEEHKKAGNTATAKAITAIALGLQNAPSDGTAPSEDQADEVFADAAAALRNPMREAREKGVRAATLANAVSVGTASRPDL